MNFIKYFFLGMGSILSLPSAPLYRYPYRNSAEGLRADCIKVGHDIYNLWERRNVSGE